MVKFYTKSKVYSGLGERDVIVSLNTYKGVKFLRFSFSKRAKEFICEESIYMMIGRDPSKANRIYFAKGNVIDGYKLIPPKSNGDRYGAAFGRGKDSITSNLTFTGVYDLQFDAEQNAFYIEKADDKNV